jgi:hypothetical protein
MWFEPLRKNPSSLPCKKKIIIIKIKIPHISEKKKRNPSGRASLRRLPWPNPPLLNQNFQCVTQGPAFY